jgi:hypothetical protein
MVLNNKTRQRTLNLIIDDPKSFDGFKHDYAYRIYVYASMLKTEDLQKQHEILNEVGLIDLGMIKPL